MRKKAKLNHDTKKRAPDLPPMKEGDDVYLKDLGINGKVVRSAEQPCSYVFDTPWGDFRRNRSHCVQLCNSPRDEVLCDNDQPLSNTNDQSDTFFYQTHVMIPENATIRRSGRVSKPPERLITKI